MTYEEAEKILELREKFEDKCCTCFQGNAPCSYCENCPSDELCEEASSIISNEILGDKYV